MTSLLTFRFCSLLICLSVLVAFCPAAQASHPDDLLIIANSAVPTDVMPLSEIREIFLKRRLNWNTTDKATPVNSRNGNKARDIFRSKVLKMTESEEALFFQNLKISHGINKPAEFSNPLKAVFRLKSSVSYILRSEFKENLPNVKLILVIPAEK